MEPSSSTSPKESPRTTWSTALRRLADTRKIGHLGTLDPMATGVLPLVIGRATRLAQFFSTGEKKYEARIRFGWATDTYDREGTPVSESVDAELFTRRAGSRFGALSWNFSANPAALFGQEDCRHAGLQTGAQKNSGEVDAGGSADLRAGSGRVRWHIGPDSRALLGRNLPARHRPRSLARIFRLRGVPGITAAHRFGEFTEEQALSLEKLASWLKPAVCRTR